MLKLGALVKPIRPPLTWRLGVVEALLDDGRYRVRAYVAPPQSYAGTAAAYAADEIAEVPRERVRAFLATTEAELERLATLTRQIEAALEAASI